jgi:hypothetical protein
MYDVISKLSSEPGGTYDDEHCQILQSPRTFEKDQGRALSSQSRFFQLFSSSEQVAPCHYNSYRRMMVDYSSGRSCFVFWHQMRLC